MSLDVPGIFDAVQSHALASGYFERVNGHEPKNPPGKGLSAAVWVDRIAPARSSGLASTSVVLTLNVRVYSNMLAEPQDAIDPNVLGAVSALMGAYSGDFTLGGLVRHVDLLGKHGTPLSAQAGYIEISGVMYRVMTIVVPVVANDAWEQVA